MSAKKNCMRRNDLIQIVRRRIDETGTKEPSIQRQGIIVSWCSCPGWTAPNTIKSLLGKTAKLTFHLVEPVGSAGLVPKQGVIAAASTDDRTGRRNGSAVAVGISGAAARTFGRMVPIWLTQGRRYEGQPVVSFESLIHKVPGCLARRLRNIPDV
jgi:preprotein translocase subunit SecD